MYFQSIAIKAAIIRQQVLRLRQVKSKVLYLKNGASSSSNIIFGDSVHN